MTRALERLRQTERWIALVRLIAVPFAAVEVGVVSSGYPPGYETYAWIITGILAGGAVALWLLARRDLAPAAQRALGFSALAFDAAVVAAYAVLYYSYELNTPVRQVLFLPVAEAAVRFGVAGGVLLPLLLAPFLAWGEHLRADRYHQDFSADAVTLPLGIQILVGLIVAGYQAGSGPRRRRPRHERPKPRCCATSSAGARTSSRP